MNSSPILMWSRFAAAPAQRCAGIAKVEVHQGPGAVLQDWAELEALAPASAYQSRVFLTAWIETIGAARGITPMLVLARSAAGQPLVLLGLGVKRIGPFRVATFLGNKESNFNLGLIRPGVSMTAADISFLLQEAAKAAGPAAPHLYLLQNQPYEWEGVANPFALLPHSPSPSFAYATELDSNGEKFLAAKLSKEAHKKLRKKAARFTQTGPITVVSNDTQANAAAILDAFLAQKIARCKARSIAADFSDLSLRAFFERLSYPGETHAPWLEFHALKAGNRIVATYAGAAHRGRFSCLVNSFDADPDIAKLSPGDLLLMHLVARLCDRGLASFDLGIGEARYKTTYCDVTVPLFDTILPVGVAGWLCAGLASLRLRAKRFIKRHPKMLAATQAMQRIVPGLAML